VPREQASSATLRGPDDDAIPGRTTRIGRSGERPSLVEERLQELGCTRKIALCVPHFSVLPEVIATTDILLTVPSRIANMFASQHAVAAFDLPFAVPDLEVMLRWHGHSGDIVAQRWLFQTLRECLAGL
jgi:DNA-binding transcriptional LysR family regulator